MNGRTVVMSLGAGVQSSAMLLMACRGELPYEPDLALFADTQQERAGTYEWLPVLRMEAHKAGIELATVTAGDLGADVIAHAEGRRPRVSNPPLFLKTDDGGMARRSCTRDYKIRPQHRELRRRGFGPSRPVLQLQGITIDEIERVSPRKPGDPLWVERAYPFVEMEWTRFDCERWLVDHGYPIPPKSACLFCPYMSDSRWRDMKRNNPEEWDKAVAFDHAIRHLPTLDAPAFVHRQCVPLDEVYLAEDQGELFSDECEGYCGV